MPLTPTDFYRRRLVTLHQQLLDHSVTNTYLTGTGIRLDGATLTAADRFAWPIGELSTLEFAHLFSVFDGSRAHVQAEKRPSADDAPPGLYVTVVNHKLIRNQHKNRSGLFVEETGGADLFIEGLHLDHFFLNERKTPPGLGTFAFTLCAITAHLAGLGHISLVAAGGKGFNLRHIGYKVWPRLGFDAKLLPGEVNGVPHLQTCKTVQDVVATDLPWWDEHGSQRHMSFGLGADSVSWSKLIPFVRNKLNAGEAHGQDR